MAIRVSDPPGERLGTLLPTLRVEPPGPASRELAARLREVESRNVTYADDGWPVFWDEARGANVRDADGNIYLDLTGAFGVALLGHAHPRVAAALEAQARRLVHGMGDIHPPSAKLELLERLGARAPWPSSRSVLASAGSEAVEIALKTALLATGKPGVIAFEGAYHGLTAGSLAVTDREHFRAAFAPRLYGGVAFAPFPDPLRQGEQAADQSLARVAGILRQGAPNGDGIGAVIIEPIQGRAGVRVPPPGFMEGLSRLAREAGAIVVADEIFTGSGRCGAMFASTALGLEPDLICLGKALGGGMPLSACLGSAEVMDAWPESSGEAVHTSTFLGHPLACAAASAVLAVHEEERVFDQVERLGDDLAGRLRERLEGDSPADGARPRVGDVRGRGLMLGIELVEGAASSPAAGAAVRAAEALLRRGVLALPAGAHGHVLELTPPVTLSDAQLQHAVDAIADALEALA